MPFDEQHTNRLAKESSPYLLQHAHNPVDWYPWGEEALGAAQRDAKPILLSVGYSACHWCHVMERESFENPEIAEVMNRHFINIKVDREERPDLDSIYMNFVQMTTGSGGWPLTVFLTPDQVPFFGGTYFPPEDSYGRPGFRSLLERVAQLYQSRREELVQNREALVGKLEEQVRPQQAQAPADEKLLDGLLSPLRQQWDPRHGGFGGAPKFPSAMALAFLLRYYRRKGTEVALEMVTVSLDEMARGGIYDQLGGGFHRYSVDERWLVPHFEKMLYDNALLVSLYVEAYQVTGRSLYRQVVEETLGYVKREMRDPAGGFYSSQDADSEGEEGKFYVWTPQEVEHVLGRAEAQVFNEYFDVTAAGNFEGKNILHHRVERDSYAGSARLQCRRAAGAPGRLPWSTFAGALQAHRTETRRQGSGRLERHDVERLRSGRLCPRSTRLPGGCSKLRRLSVLADVCTGKVAPHLEGGPGVLSGFPGGLRTRHRRVSGYLPGRRRGCLVGPSSGADAAAAEPVRRRRRRGFLLHTR